MSSFATLAGDFRKAVHSVAEDLLGDDDTKVAWGSIGREYTDDMIVIGPVRTEQATATTNRGREVTLTIEVEFHSYRRGNADEADQQAFARMCEMAGTLAEHLRSAAEPENTTLGALVRDCMEREFDSDSTDLQATSGSGRLWVGLVIYEAHARLRG